MKKNQKTRPKKRYVPYKQAQKKFEEIRQSTWFAGGSWQDKLGTIAGNFDYPELLSPRLAKIIIDMQNVWSCLLVAHHENQLELFTRFEKTADITEYVTRQQAEEIITPQLEKFQAAQNQNTLISVSWFMVPQTSLDLIAIKSEIATLLEREGAADKLLCNLATESRINDIETHHAERAA